MSSSDNFIACQNTPKPLSKRDDYATVHKRQAAANALQNYSILALQSIKDEQCPARSRLKMMSIITDLSSENDPYKYSTIKKS